MHVAHLGFTAPLYQQLLPGLSLHSSHVGVMIPSLRLALRTEQRTTIHSMQVTIDANGMMRVVHLVDMDAQAAVRANPYQRRGRGNDQGEPSVQVCDCHASSSLHVT